MKHIEVSADRQTKIRVRAVLPLVLERRAMDAGQPHIGHSASGNVEPGRDADDVDLVYGAVFELDPGLGERHDGVILDIHDLDILPVELLEVGFFETRTLDAEVVRWLARRKQLPGLWVADALADLSAPEVVHDAVGFGVEEVVAVIGDPEAEAPFGP